jgi:hydroxymethylpyrimidine/phosphomethylpyrimidine kinase
LAEAKSGALVAKLLENWARPIVVDPRLFDRFSKRCAMEALDDVIRDKVLKLASVACLNIFEAEVLARMTLRDMDSRRDALKALFDLGVSFPVVMSSKNDRHAVDIGYDGYGFFEFGDDRVDVEHDGGAGAVFSTAIAVKMARGASTLDAIEAAKRFVSVSIRHSVNVGGGLVPVNPLSDLYRGSGLSLAVVAEDDGDE